MTSAQREFLVQRLMEDSQKMRKSATTVIQKPPLAANSSDSDVDHSDSSSDPGMANGHNNGALDSETAAVPLLPGNGTLDPISGRISGQNNSSSLFAAGNPLQYAATLVSLAQMNFLPPAAASTLPLLYPHLYQSLLTMPNLERLRFYPQSPTELLARLSSANGKTPPGGAVDKLLDADVVTSSAPVVATPKANHQQLTPSPRKRSSQTAKNVDPKKSDPLTASDYGNGETPKKPRAIRKIQFDDEKSSPVSGMYIKDMPDVVVDDSGDLVNGNIGHQQDMLLHESADFVKITEEAKKELAKIPNVIGDYVCQLCKLKYDDAFRLAMHKCPRIGHKIYRCPECDKVFSCPANLASHRRWHRPKDDATTLGKSPAKYPTLENGKGHQNLQHLPSSFMAPLDSPVSITTEDDPIDLTSKTSATAIAKVIDDYDQNQDQVDFSVFSANGAVAAYFQCEFCQKKFDSHRLLRSHAVSHTNFVADVTNDETQCDSCDLWFLSRDSCDKHARRSHPKFLCKFCNESFPTSPALTRHINKRHPTSNECRATAFVQDYLCTSDNVITTVNK